MNISVVIPIWKRSHKHLDDLLGTIANQASEVIVVDMTPDEGYSKKTTEVCELHGATAILAPSQTFNMSRCVNIGIKATSASSEAVLCTGSEMFFSPGFMEEVERIYRSHNGNVFIQSQCGFLQEGQTTDNLFDCNYNDLESRIAPFPPRLAGGAILCASRRWWFFARGYNEILPFWRADTDVERRAEKYGLARDCVKFENARLYHQWHNPEQKKELLGKLGGDWRKSFGVVANPGGWGEL